MKSFKKIIIGLVVLMVVCASLIVGGYYFLISAPAKSEEEVTINVGEGQTYTSISSLLKENNLIRNEVAYKIYLKLNPPKTLEHGNYVIPKNSSVEDLIGILEKGTVSSAQTVTVKFIPGKNMRYVIKTITENFGYSEDEILNVLKDETYLDTLVNKYWFLGDEIKNKDLYYSLEGYLYPDTYEFYTNASIKDIFEKLLDNMGSKVEQYKSEIESSKYSFHEILTLSSIIELEAGSADDRKGVAGVFYNRLKSGMSLGSDVTTYYAERIDNWSRDLKQSELDKCNQYNTRSNCLVGKLPVGPICNPSIKSLSAAIEPTDHNYYFFVADKNGKTYFNETYAKHSSTVSRLKKEGLWIEYES